MIMIAKKPFPWPAYWLPECLDGMTCEDVAECLDLPESLASALAALEYMPIADVWPYMTAPARKYVIRAAEAEEARCAELAEAVGL